MLRKISESIKHLEFRGDFHARYLEAQNAISLAISRQLNLKQLLETVLSRVIHLLELDMGGITLLEPDGSGMKMWAYIGTTPEIYQATAHMPIGDGIAGWVVTQKKSLVLNISDYPSQAIYPLLVKEGIKTLVGIPLISKEKVMGALVLASKAERVFDSEELNMLNTFGFQIAVAIENTRLYEQVLQEKRYAESVIQSISDGVYTVDRNRVILSWNKGAEEITGYGVQDVLGKTCPEILGHQDEASQLFCETGLCPLKRAWDAGTPAEPARVFSRSKSGRLIPVSLSASAIVDSHGRKLGAVEVFRNVSKEVELIRGIQLASQAKSNFLAGMSHELRTPMNAILGFSEVLSEEYFGPLNDKQREYVSDILSSGNHLLSLINDVLDLSKVEAGQELGRFYVMDILEDSMLMVREKAIKHGIRLKLDIPRDMETCQIDADARKLKQVLFNLLANAVKFTPDGGSVALKTRFSDPSSNTLQIIVEDTGIGIDPDHLPRIFEEFYQIQNGAVNKTPGTGLGLSLSRQFVQLHGGDIRAESEGPGKGSRFVIELPCRPTWVRG